MERVGFVLGFHRGVWSDHAGEHFDTPWHIETSKDKRLTCEHGDSAV